MSQDALLVGYMAGYMQKKAEAEKPGVWDGITSGVSKWWDNPENDKKKEYLLTTAAGMAAGGAIGGVADGWSGAAKGAVTGGALAAGGKYGYDEFVAKPQEDLRSQLQAAKDLAAAETKNSQEEISDVRNKAKNEINEVKDAVQADKNEVATENQIKLDNIEGKTEDRVTRNLYDNMYKKIDALTAQERKITEKLQSVRQNTPTITPNSGSSDIPGTQAEMDVNRNKGIQAQENIMSKQLASVREEIKRYNTQLNNMMRR